MRAARAIGAIVSVVLAASVVRAQYRPEGGPPEERPIDGIEIGYVCRLPGARARVDEVIRRVRARSWELVRCTEASGGRPVRGAVEIALWVAPEGRARDVRAIVDEVGVPPVTECLLRVVASTPMPTYEGSDDRAEVRLPLRFVER